MSNSEKFKKYSSIENYYQEGFFITLCKATAQDEYLWCVTEKIHGANFQVYYDGEDFLIGSRNRWLNPNENFYNLYNLINEIKPNIMELMMEFSKKPPIRLYGEVYGDGVQKGVKYSKEKRIRFFDIKVQDDYMPYAQAEYFFEKFNIPYIRVKEKIQGTINEVINKVNTHFNSEVAEGEYATLENNLCEGVVIKPYMFNAYTDKGERVIIKKKNEEFLEKSKFPKTPNPKKEIAYSQCIEDVKPYINNNRFDSVFSKDNYQKPDFGTFIKAYAQDVVEDASKDNIEFKDIKILNNIIAKNTKEEYFRRVA